MIPDMYLYELIEICITQNWENLNPCEIPQFKGLCFPDEMGKCKGNCVNCLLVASGHERIYTP